ncbi:hypothetical protein ACFZDK_11830 [Streptomyces sp. NPDC007901]|uniref:hypothetical protein n=1 Tax=Streptomyces sp. NPDC007901 TaxID=3364785 RepID=UPI0036EB27BC
MSDVRLPPRERAQPPQADARTTTATTPHPVPLRPTTPLSTAAPLPVAPLNLPTIQRDALTTALPPAAITGTKTSLKKEPVTTTTPPPPAPVTKAPRQLPPDGPPPPPPGGHVVTAENDDLPPEYRAVEEGGFDPGALTEYQVDALVHRIIDRITRHVRTELRRDRERVGKLRDFRP